MPSSSAKELGNCLAFLTGKCTESTRLSGAMLIYFPYPVTTLEKLHYQYITSLVIFVTQQRAPGDHVHPYIFLVSFLYYKNSLDLQRSVCKGSHHMNLRRMSRFCKNSKFTCIHIFYGQRDFCGYLVYFTSPKPGPLKLASFTLPVIHFGNLQIFFT